MAAPICWRAALAVLFCVPTLPAAESPGGADSPFSVVSILHDVQALARPHPGRMRTWCAAAAQEPE